jgi:protein AATF/BFR2
MKKSLADELAELSHPAPPRGSQIFSHISHSCIAIDIDPEADFGRAHADSESEDQSDRDSDAGRSHYTNVGRRQLGASDADRLAATDAKYRGQRVSRSDVFGGSESDEADDVSAGEEEFDQADSDALSDHQQEDESQSEAESDGGTQEPLRLRPMPSQSAQDESERGQHTRHQLSFYDGLLDVRIRSQRCLNVANALPPADLQDLYFGHLDQVDASYKPMADQMKVKSEEAKSAVAQLITSLHQLRTTMVQHDAEIYEQAAPSTLSSFEFDVDAPLDRMWAKLNALDETLLNRFRDEVLNKWHAKVQVASVGTSLSSKQFKAFNQSKASEQIQNTLTSDHQRLLKRTQMVRGTVPRVGRALMHSIKRKREDADDDRIHDQVQNEDEGDALDRQQRRQRAQQEADEWDEDVFDDNDYYATVLRELIDSKVGHQMEGGDAGSDPLAMGVHWAKIKELQRRSKKHRANVDRRASKGRRLRYDVHEKLVSFMVPMEPPGQWHDEMTTSLFQRLLESQKA